MEEIEKTETASRRKELFSEKKNGYDILPAEEMPAMESFCEEYKKFLDNGKTERECVTYAISLAEAKGFRAYVRGRALAAGDRVYCENRGKGIMLAVIGTEKMDKGVNICASHIDSPRLDIKPTPLYEDTDMAFLKTHYYGGIRKYQWVTIPLELHGVVVLKSGDTVAVSIGGNEADPIFTVDDLLPHLATEQSKKPLSEAIPAESLNLLVGSRPFKDDKESERVKLNILDILNKRYGITEADFLSAELCAVPNFCARDVGFDRSLIGAYGHDDRVCAFPALSAILNAGTPLRTAVCVLADKEEIGSMGVSGMQSQAFDTFLADLCEAQEVKLRDCFANSFCLSADVTAAYDPNFPDVYDKRNSALVNCGIGICKYTGARGKSGCNDAPAEVVGYIRRVFDGAGVLWQLAELGKADVGGGGTVALFMANRNIDTIDAGVPVLSMHAPFETVAKLDCYMAYKAMQAVYSSQE